MKVWAVLLVSAVVLLPAHAVKASESTANSTFEIKITTEKISKLILENFGELETIKSSNIDPLKSRKEALQKYFTEVRPSALVNYVDVLAEQSQWRKIIAISFVESTMCKRHYYNNCWGITYRSGLAKYPSFAEAIVDTNRVLEKRYSDKTYEQMNGVYVQPKNPNWLRGAKQIEAELDTHVEPRA